MLYEVITVSEGVKALCAKGCRLHNVGKRYADGVDQSRRLQAIVELVLTHLAAGRQVVRLKGGDPAIFSRSVEEIELLRQHGVEVEMVPGITSGIAAGSTALLPLTERSESDGLMLVTGSTLDERTDHLQTIVQWIVLGNTVLLYMGFKRFAEIRNLMYGFGLLPDTPVCAISRVSLPNELCLFSTVDRLPDDAEKAALPMPVVIVLGVRIRSLK